MSCIITLTTRTDVYIYVSTDVYWQCIILGNTHVGGLVPAAWACLPGDFDAERLEDVPLFGEEDLEDGIVLGSGSHQQGYINNTLMSGASTYSKQEDF